MGAFGQGSRNVTCMCLETTFTGTIFPNEFWHMSPAFQPQFCLHIVTFYVDDLFLALPHSLVMHLNSIYACPDDLLETLIHSNIHNHIYSERNNCINQR